MLRIRLVIADRRLSFCRVLRRYLRRSMTSRSLRRALMEPVASKQFVG